jgi:hypothetical protein
LQLPTASTDLQVGTHSFDLSTTTMASFPRRPARETNWRQRNDSLSALEVYMLDELDFTIEVSMLPALEQITQTWLAGVCVIDIIADRFVARNLTSSQEILLPRQSFAWYENCRRLSSAFWSFAWYENCRKLYHLLLWYTGLRGLRRVKFCQHWQNFTYFKLGVNDDV